MKRVLDRAGMTFLATLAVFTVVAVITREDVPVVTDGPTSYATTNVEEIGTPTARPPNWRERPEYQVSPR